MSRCLVCRDHVARAYLFPARGWSILFLMANSIKYMHPDDPDERVVESTDLPHVVAARLARGFVVVEGDVPDGEVSDDDDTDSGDRREGDDE